MAHIKNILVPMDGSATSLAALVEATALAEDVGARIEVFHVSAPDQFGIGSTTATARGAQDSDNRAMQEAIAAAEVRLGERLRSATDTGDPIVKILERAASEKFDLIVIGTHGRTGRLRELIGSVAENIIRNSPCPVLTVRHPDGAEESFAERIHHRPTVAEQTGGAR